MFSTLNLGGPDPLFNPGTDFQLGLKSYTLCERLMKWIATARCESCNYEKEGAPVPVGISGRIHEQETGHSVLATVPAKYLERLQTSDRMRKAP